MPTDDLTLDHGGAWLHKPESDDSPTNTSGYDGDELGSRAQGSHRYPTDRSRSVAIAATVAVILAGSAIVVGATVIDSRSHDAVTASTSEAAVTSTGTTMAGEQACSGLRAQTVTAGIGDPRSLPGVVAAFEHAYYVTRHVETAMALVSPQAGLVPEALASAIADLPVGTTHCVAISPIAENTAEVHLVELRPDGSRFDYLQLINVAARTDSAGLVITNIQKRGN